MAKKCVPKHFLDQVDFEKFWAIHADRNIGTFLEEILGKKLRIKYLFWNNNFGK